MRNRKTQRMLKKRQKAKIEKPWLNSEGYYDPTAYQAMKNIEHEKHR